MGIIGNSRMGDVLRCFFLGEVVLLSMGSKVK